MKKRHSPHLKDLSAKFLIESVKSDYSYNFKWLSRPIIQYPQDVLAVQELVWKIKPDLIIETGIAHGGSLIFSASIQALIDYEEAFKSGELLDPLRPKRKVIGIDIDIRSHNREALDNHFLRPRLTLIEGSSIDPHIIESVKDIAKNASTIMVFLDSNHTHDHVLAELEAYAPLVSIGSYCIVFDTVIENLPDKLSENRPWCIGDNPKTAVKEFIEKNESFVVNDDIDEKILISVAPGGYLKRI